MSNRFGWSTRGALSPFSSNLGQSSGGIPAITDDDFSYITSEDLEGHGLDIPRRAHRSAHDGSSSHYGRSAPQVPEEDDVLIIKNKGTTYLEQFPAYSIGDGQVLVRDLQERVQLIMKLSDRRARRLRLLYKGRQLKDLDKPIQDYGVKNNSEILVVLGDVAAGESSDESSEEVVVVDRDATATRQKPGKKRRGKKRGSARSPPDSSSNTGLEVPYGHERKGASSSRAESPSGLSGVSGASAAAAVPGGPIDKLNSIDMHFRTKLLPLCTKFAASPPADPKKREDEHRRISETVMQQVLLKLDEVDILGEEEARARRKELVRHVQSVLKDMDSQLNG